MLGQLNATLEEENKALVEQVNKLVEQVNMNIDINKKYLTALSLISIRIPTAVFYTFPLQLSLGEFCRDDLSPLAQAFGYPPDKSLFR